MTYNPIDEFGSVYYGDGIAKLLKNKFKFKYTIANIIQKEFLGTLGLIYCD